MRDVVKTANLTNGVRRLGLTCRVRNVRIDGRAVARGMMRVAVEKKKFANSRVNEQRTSSHSFYGAILLPQRKLVRVMGESPNSDKKKIN